MDKTRDNRERDCYAGTYKGGFPYKMSIRYQEPPLPPYQGASAQDLRDKKSGIGVPSYSV